MTSNRLKKLKLCYDVTGKELFKLKYVAKTNPLMAGDWSQVAVKRLTCSNILGSQTASGISLSFENVCTVKHVLQCATLLRTMAK